MSADFGDEGSRLEEQARMESLAVLSAATARAAREPVAPPTHPVDCVDCGERIPPLRLQLNPRTRRCTPCASDIEGPRFAR